MVAATSPVRYLAGAAFGLGAVSIWAGWLVVARLGLKTSLTPWDITALRFGVAGLLLLPYLMRKGLAIDRLGWSGLTALVVGGGAPMVLLANAGLMYAPAAHAGALYSGMVPVLVSFLAAAYLREPFTLVKQVGCVLILAGACGIVLNKGIAFGSAQTIGHVLFLAAGFVWACYTVALKRTDLNSLHGAALAAVSGIVLYVPFYLLSSGTVLLGANLSDVLVQVVVQGVLTAIVALMLYGRAVAILGASGAAAFSALVPAATAVLAIPLLGEWPMLGETLAIAAITLGAYLVSGGPLPPRRSALQND